ncbi:MAG: hypothetical protein HC767_10950 [Akkermansiaceae bacterium]|nr:hypothetical protein [Akkermansiaceae bacterium]
MKAAESHLELAWRTNMTNLLCNAFFNSHTHYRVVHTEGIDNPDQRISQDVANFVVTSSKLILKMTSTIFNTVAFGGVPCSSPIPGPIPVLQCPLACCLVVSTA